MRQKKWRGTALFVGILAVMGLTIGLRLYGVGPIATASALTAPAATAPATATAGSAPPPTPTASSKPTTASAAAPAAVPNTTKTITGAVVQTPFGPVQVAVTFHGKTITAVKELQSPNAHSYSIAINAQAAPMLLQEVLQSQSAHINTISGATYTSEGYAQSVQSAIDQL